MSHARRSSLSSRPQGRSRRSYPRPGGSGAPGAAVALAGAFVAVFAALGGCSGDETQQGTASTGTPTGPTTGTGMGPGPGATGTGGDLFGSSSSSAGAGGMPVDCDNDKTEGPVQWAKNFGDAQGQFVQSVAVDGAGNIFLTGSFTGAVDFGGGALTSAGMNDVFIVKLDASGGHVWSKRYGTAKDQAGRSIAVDGAGNAYVTGYYLGTIDFGTGAMTSQGGLFEDIFVAKLDPMGNTVWAKGFGDPGAQTSRSIAVDAAGNSVVVGDFQEFIDFGGGPLQSTGNSEIDAFAVKFDPAGGHMWSKRYGDAVRQSAEEVALDGAGNVVITGYANGSIDFGKGALTAPGDKGAAFVAKLGPSGDAMWASIFGDEARGLGIDVDAGGDIAVTGAFKGTIDFGGGKLAAQSANDSVFVALFDGAGKHQWSHSFGSSSSEGLSVAIDGKAKVIVGGAFSGAIDFGGPNLMSAGAFDAFLAKLDSVGCHVWSGKFGDAAYQVIQHVTLDASGNVVITGRFAGTADFGTGALTANGDDIFVAKFGP